MRKSVVVVLVWLLIILPIPGAAQTGCGVYTSDQWTNINYGGAVLSYQDLLGDGTLTNASLSPEAYSYLVVNGFLPNYTSVTMDYESYVQYINSGSNSIAAQVILVTTAIPGVGEVVIFVAGAAALIYISAQAGIAIGTWVAARQGNADPLAVRDIYNAGSVQNTRDANGNCSPTPGGYKWQARDKNAHGGLVHWHWFDFNQDPVSCLLYPGPRMEGDNDPGPSYTLIPGIYVFDGTIE